MKFGKYYIYCIFAPKDIYFLYDNFWFLVGRNLERQVSTSCEKSCYGRENVEWIEDAVMKQLGNRPNRTNICIVDEKSVQRNNSQILYACFAHSS